ncbi:c-type cytochrome [Aurantiacibacter gilvus]|uniref:C-type cytochrome n=1 Tax=Aurantiacibacter gilvus TaxID=3139141 RepID=A0ABU9IHI8_9SPHN
MRITLALATSTALALALTACGAPTDEELEEDVASVDAEQLADSREIHEAVEEGDEEEALEILDEEEEEAGPVPAASATPSAAATVAAAPATPPASFTTCGVCHSVEPGQNGVGPTLAGVVGRRAGAVAGANYSPAMQGANITWTEANLRRYLADPNAVVPGGLMPAPGLDQAEITAVVNYLKTL